MKSIKLRTKYIISYAVSNILAIYNYLPLASHQSRKVVQLKYHFRTLYFLRFLFIGILFFMSTHSFAQKLLLENNVSLTNYKLGYLRQVRISSVNDSTKTFGAYIKKVNHDTLYFIGGKKIALADIYTIRFTPRNVFTKYGKPYTYSFGVFISGFVAIVFSTTEQTYSVGQRFLIFGGGTLYSTILIETAGTALWLITPKRELRKGINLTILNK
jgi:hypothetical protein